MSTKRKKGIFLSGAILLFLLFLMLFAKRNALSIQRQEAVNAYASLLRGEIGFTSGEYIVFLKVTDATKVAVLDMNGDDIPELATGIVIQQWYDKNMALSSGTHQCGIYSFKDGEISEWYSGSTRTDFEILSNGALLYRHEEAWPEGYDYLELNKDGTIAKCVSAYKYIVSTTGQWKYYIDTEPGDAQAVSEEQWNRTVENYLALRENAPTWKDCSSMRQGDGSSVLVPEKGDDSPSNSEMSK